jgi:hypothetical protein
MRWGGFRGRLLCGLLLLVPVVGGSAGTLVSGPDADARVAGFSLGVLEAVGVEIVGIYREDLGVALF